MNTGMTSAKRGSLPRRDRADSLGVASREGAAPRGSLGGSRVGGWNATQSKFHCSVGPSHTSLDMARFLQWR